MAEHDDWVAKTQKTLQQDCSRWESLQAKDKKYKCEIRDRQGNLMTWRQWFISLGMSDD